MAGSEILHFPRGTPPIDRRSQIASDESVAQVPKISKQCKDEGIEYHPDKTFVTTMVMNKS